MFDPIQKPEDGIGFTPLWYISGALILAAGITLFFTSHRVIADILNIAGCLVLIFAGLRNKRDTTKPLALGLTPSCKKASIL
jgi:threonine/homoserine/homoserine lactone efflux protein